MKVKLLEEPEIKVDQEELKESFQQCPNCNTPYEKEVDQNGKDTCNLMTCKSSQCKNSIRGYTEFCYLCGEDISESKKETHFQNNGGKCDPLGGMPIRA